MEDSTETPTTEEIILFATTVLKLSISDLRLLSFPMLIGLMNKYNDIRTPTPTIKKATQEDIDEFF